MKHQLALAIGVVLLGAGSTASAITDTETNASIPFNLANPGARSMGMGGAFLGLADDATAAYTNPAGLTQLVTPEVSIEMRHTDYSIPYVNGGSVSLGPFNGSGITTSNADSSNNNVSFLAAVLPHDQWSFAVYRDELVHFSNDFATGANGVTIPFPDLNETFETYPVTAHANLKIVDYGVTAAWKASDNISIGAGLSYYDFNLDTVMTRVEFPNNAANIPAGTPVNQQVQHGSDNDVGLNLGARFVLSEHWSMGLTYRRGPKFEYEATNTDLLSSSVFTDLKNVQFKVPDEFGAGLSWHPTDALVVNFDTDYIQYSQLTHGMQGLFSGDTATGVSHLSVPNGTEIHLGGEYTFTQMAHPISLRVGIWHDPRHSIEYKGDPGTDDTVAAGLASLFFGGKGPQTHGAVGLGWVFSKFQIDAAADFSDVTDTYSVSAVYHF
jgi:long-chain fatty acid transport protein